MTTFTVPTKEEVSENNQAIFDNLNKALGFVPNLYATIAYSKNGLERFWLIKMLKHPFQTKKKKP